MEELFVCTSDFLHSQLFTALSVAVDSKINICFDFVTDIFKTDVFNIYNIDIVESMERVYFDLISTLFKQYGWSVHLYEHILYIPSIGDINEASDIIVSSDDLEKTISDIFMAYIQYEDTYYMTNGFINAYEFENPALSDDTIKEISKTLGLGYSKCATGKKIIIPCVPLTVAGDIYTDDDYLVVIGLLFSNVHKLHSLLKQTHQTDSLS